MKHVENALRVFESPGKKAVYCLEVVDDVLYAGAADNKIRSYNILTGAIMHTYAAHTNYVTCIRAQKGTIPPPLHSASGTQATATATAPAAAPSVVGTAQSTQAAQTAQATPTSGIATVDVLLFSGSNDKTARLWDAMTGQCVRVFKKGHSSHIYTVCPDPSGQRLFTGGGDNVIVEWSVATEERVRLFKGHTDWVRDMQIVGKFLYSGSNDATIRKWDIDTGSCVHSYPGHNRIFCVCVSGDKIFAGSSDKLVRAVDRETGAFVREFSGHKGPVLCLQATSGGDILTSSGDKCVRQWDVRTGECITLFKGHSDWVRAVRYCRGVVFSGGDDGYIRMWSVYGDSTPADSAFGGSSIMSQTQLYMAAQGVGAPAMEYDRRSIASSSSRLSLGSQFMSGAGPSGITAAVHAMASGVPNGATGGGAVSRALLEAHDLHTRRINELEAINYDQLKIISALEYQREIHLKEEMAWAAEKATLTEQIRALQTSLKDVILQAPEASRVVLKNIGLARQCLDDIEFEVRHKRRTSTATSSISEDGDVADDEA
eukprot:Opistho-2@94509